MRSPRFIHTLQALFMSGFVVFALNLSHLSIGEQSMPNMQDVSGHEHTSSLQCEMLCTAVVTSKDTILATIENHVKDPLPPITFIATSSLSLLALSFVIKRLHLLSSWRPPDRTLLCGHYSDGL